MILEKNSQSFSCNWVNSSFLLHQIVCSLHCLFAPKGLLFNHQFQVVCTWRIKTYAQISILCCLSFISILILNFVVRLVKIHNVATVSKGAKRQLRNIMTLLPASKTKKSSIGDFAGSSILIQTCLIFSSISIGSSQVQSAALSNHFF